MTRHVAGASLLRAFPQALQGALIDIDGVNRSAGAGGLCDRRCEHSVPGIEIGDLIAFLQFDSPKNLVEPHPLEPLLLPRFSCGCGRRRGQCKTQQAKDQVP